MTFFGAVLMQNYLAVLDYSSGKAGIATRAATSALCSTA